MSTPRFSEWFGRRSERDPTRMALLFGERTWTFAELQSASALLEQSLIAAGIRPGDRVAFSAPNHPSFFQIALAVNRLGAVLVPINPRLTTAEISAILQQSGTGLI